MMQFHLDQFIAVFRKTPKRRRTVGRARLYHRHRCNSRKEIRFNLKLATPISSVRCSVVRVRVRARVRVQSPESRVQSVKRVSALKAGASQKGWQGQNLENWATKTMQVGKGFEERQVTD